VDLEAVEVVSQVVVDLVIDKPEPQHQLVVHHHKVMTEEQEIPLPMVLVVVEEVLVAMELQLLDLVVEMVGLVDCLQ